MKTRAKIALCCVILPFLLATSACGMGASAQLANELRFPLEDITSITI